MDRNRRSGWGLVGLGLVVAITAQLATLLGSPPLYDGVVVLEPYLWLDPRPDHPGGAQGESATVAVEAAGNALVALATPESEPQALLLATPGSLILPAGATSIVASIIPVEPVSLPPGGYIDGNTYRIELTDQAGDEVTADPSAAGSAV